MRPARGMEHSLCVLRKTCGELPVLEHNGDFYSCDHFVDREHLLGNISERSLLEVLESAEQSRFGRFMAVNWLRPGQNYFAPQWPAH